MSYDDDRRGGSYGGGRDGYEGGGQGYGGGRDDYQGGGGDGPRRGDYSNPQEYGGGGRQGDNYYDQGENYSERPQRQEGGGRHGRGGGGYDDEFGGAVQHAQQHGSSGDEGLFSQATNFLSQHKGRIQNEDVDEGQMVNAHQTLYGGGGSQSGNHDANTLGAGAAMQALKMFTGGDGQQGGLGGAGGNSQNQFIGMAMGQASKLFDQQSGQGNVASGTDKQSVVTQAGEMALKMYMKSQMGGGGGGLGGLMGMASKFM